MGQILRDYTFRISEGKLRLGERDPMLFLVLLVPFRVPFEAGFCHKQSLPRIGLHSHMFVWLEGRRSRGSLTLRMSAFAPVG